jgi:hypothetical protein
VNPPRRALALKAEMRSPLVLHALRGLVGFAALGFVFLVGVRAPTWAWVAALVTSLVAFRGCPTCWIMASSELVSARLEGRAPNATCAGGTCAVPIDRDPR